jgi:hypothetical protein
MTEKNQQETNDERVAHESFLPREIDVLSHQLEHAILKEAEARLDVSYAKEDLAEYKAQIIGKAYADGTISGGNAQSRSAAEDDLIASAPGVLEEKTRVRDLERDHARKAGVLAAMETRVSLYRAWLYQDTHIPR